MNESLDSFLNRSPRISDSDKGYGSDSNSSFASSCYTEVRDPCAKKSKITKRANLGNLAKEGDGDVWVEKLFRSKKSGKLRIYFVSMATGRRSRDEPPTGASRVIYAEDMLQGVMNLGDESKLLVNQT